jgi:site-specific DNA-methyltransferase (adenine-specific)
MGRNDRVLQDRHPFHSLCSYLGCFPPAVPRGVLHEFVRPGKVVLDPFCGSGTTLVESLLLGNPTIGIDLNPLAVAVAAAKVQLVQIEDVMDRLRDLASSYPGTADTETVPDNLRIIFHPRTLAQLVYLRDQLEDHRPEDIFIRGATLGIMHGKFRKDGTTAYLSIDMPNTFSMSPAYVRKFVRKHNLVQPPVDVFGKLRERVQWLLREGALPGSGVRRVLQGDATKLPLVLAGSGVSKVDAIVTSPPYLGVLRYGAFNWIRLWFLRHGPGAVDRMLDGTDSLDRYLSFLVSFLHSAAEVLPAGGPVALVIGDVKEFGTHLRLGERVWSEVRDLVPFKLVALEEDNFDQNVKTTRIWGEERKGRATPLDRILVLERAALKRPRKAPQDSVALS